MFLWNVPGTFKRNIERTFCRNIQRTFAENVPGTYPAVQMKMSVSRKEKDMKMGDSEYRTSYEGIRWLKWVDKKPVQFLSNFHDPSALFEVERRQKDGSLKTIACPQMAKDYNGYMRCIDKSDQMKSLYEITRKSKKWLHRIPWHFIDVTLVNSFIILLHNMQCDFMHQC